MRIFARTVTCSWTNAMVLRFARFAGMTRARKRDSGVYVADARRFTPLCICRRHPIFRPSETYHN
jgi:hypothetical protein